MEGGEDKQTLHYTCNFLFLCSGYYSYRQGYLPEFPGSGRFSGAVVHPQKWPEDLAYAGKRVVVIGSGATAVTLVPAMAKTAAQVTMLQRSPTYVVSRPEQDAMANVLRRYLPSKVAYFLVRWRRSSSASTSSIYANAILNGSRNGSSIKHKLYWVPTTTSANISTPRYNPSGPAHVLGSRRRFVRGHQSG